MGVRLQWDGKSADVPRLRLPLQVVETVNAPRADRGTIFEGAASDDADGWRNRLIWGDNLHVLASLVDELAGQVDLIYIDPPFDSRQDYKVRINVGDGSVGGDQELAKIASVIEEKAYRDTWGKGIESYLQMLYQRLWLLKDLLSERGALFLHCDWRLNSYLRVLLDEVFGSDCFRNEIIWRRAPNLGRQAASQQLGRVIDTIFVYSRRPGSPLLGEMPSRSHAVELDSQGRPKGAKWDSVERAFFTTAPRGDYTDESIRRLSNENRVHVSSTGALSIKYFLRQGDGGRWYKDQRVDTLWDDFVVRPLRHRPKSEDRGYDTQKPEGLLERIVRWASRDNSIVLDCFTGSGTTPAVAERLGRRWVAVDIGRFAVHTTRKRLLDTPGCKPFVVANLGRYERQVWQQATTGEAVRAYLDFVVHLYGGQASTGFQHVHGTLGPRAVHVGAVDAPVTLAEIKEALDEASGAGHPAMDVLGWEFEMGLHELVQDVARAAGINLGLRRIPREVMDSRAVAAGDITFHELAYLRADTKVTKRTVHVTLADFVLPNPDLVPASVRDKVTGWRDYVDYWAVDFTFGEQRQSPSGEEGADTFHNQWQSYRTRAQRTLELTADHTYDEPGKHTVLVKVVDIFGNDTTTAVAISVR